MSNYIAEKYRTKQSILALDTEALKAYSDVIDLSIGDTDFVTDSRIIEAAMADAKRGYTHYGDPQGDPELIAAINERLISLALNGNIKAYEMIRNGLGEDPAKKYNLMGSGKVEYVLNWGNGPEDYSETEQES